MILQIFSNLNESMIGWLEESLKQQQLKHWLRSYEILIQRFSAAERVNILSFIFQVFFSNGLTVKKDIWFPTGHHQRIINFNSFSQTFYVSYTRKNHVEHRNNSGNTIFSGKMCSDWEKWVSLLQLHTEAISKATPGWAGNIWRAW